MIPTRLIMVTSSIWLAIAGFALLFAPDETLSFIGASGGDTTVHQVFGALYLGSAAANWMARGSMIGGIYSRPLSVANYMHFLVGSIILMLGLPANPLSWPYFLVLVPYCLFGILFSVLLFGWPQGLVKHGSNQM